jgi:hypothetical protein
MATFLVNAKEWKSFVGLSIVSPLLNIFYLQPKFRKFWTGVANARSVKKRALVVKKLTPRELVVDACVKVETFMASLESCADLFAEGQDEAQVESFHHMALKYIRYASFTSVSFAYSFFQLFLFVFFFLVTSILI